MGLGAADPRNRVCGRSFSTAGKARPARFEGTPLEALQAPRLTTIGVRGQ